MKILLINSNPVVSRLTALSARKEEIQIEEIQEVTELSSDTYDIVFVDADSWSKDVSDVISENIKTQKKVLFYAQDDKKENEIFDMSILKPFLPSEVSAVIRSIEQNGTTNKSVQREEETHFDILEEGAKEDKKDEFLLNLDDDLLSNNKEKKSPELLLDVKDDLFDDLPLLESNELDEKDFNKTLEAAFPLKKDDFDNDLFDETKKEKVVKTPNEEALFELDLDAENSALEKELFTTNSKNDIKVEKSDLLDFDLDESDTFDLNLDLNNDKVKALKVEESKQESLEVEEMSVLTTETKKSEIKQEGNQEKRDMETKILDELEVANIKSILENDNTQEMELSDLMTVSAPAMMSMSKNSENVKNSVDEETHEKKKKRKKSKENPSSLQTDALIETLSSLPIDTIKGLLSGATIKIQIKFPKVK